MTAVMNVQAAGPPMIAMPLSYPGCSKPQTQTPPTFAAGLFQPLDPDILSASIPTFFIGRDSDGFWLVRDVKGENAGIFLLKSSAMSFARRVSRPLGCATVFSAERFELDVENQGNPLIAYLKPLVRRLASAWRGMAKVRV